MLRRWDKQLGFVNLFIHLLYLFIYLFTDLLLTLVITFWFSQILLDATHPPTVKQSRCLILCLVCFFSNFNFG